MTFVKRCITPAGLLLMFFIMFAHEGAAQVSFDIHIGSPPPYRFAAPPEVAVIPGTYVYAVPGVDVGIFFYSGGWYRSHEGRWFRARSYNGPWTYCSVEMVPRALVELPPDRRWIPPGHRRIPYGQLKKNWASWERDRYWERGGGSHEGWHGRGGQGPQHFEGKAEKRHGRR